MARRGRPRLDKQRRKGYCPTIHFTGAPVNPIYLEVVEDLERERFKEMCKTSNGDDDEQKPEETPFDQADRDWIRGLVDKWDDWVTPDGKG